MPRVQRYRKKRKFAKRRRYGKKKYNLGVSRRNSNHYFSGVPSGLPTKRLANLRYVHSFSLTSTAGALASSQYRANSVFDPWYSGAGAQPLGFDQWATLFNNYVVLGSKMTIQFSTATNLTDPMDCGVYLGDDTSVPYTNSDNFKEARKGTSKILTSVDKPLFCVSKFSAKKLFNVTDVKDNLDRLGAAVTADPTEEGIYTIWAQAKNGNTQSVNYQVVIDYIVMFSEPKDLSPS